MPKHHPYPSNVSDDEWAFCVGYLALVRENAPQRKHDLRRVFDALRYITRTGAPWRYLPGDFPPWQAVQQQAQRWVQAGVFEAMAHDLRAIIRWLDGRHADPTAAILDSRTLQSTPTSGSRAGYDGAKRRKGSKVHAAVDTLGNLLAVVVTPANAQDRAQVGALCEAVQRVCGERVGIAFVDQGYTGETARQAAAEHAIRLEVVKHSEAKHGFVLLPRRWTVERSFGWLARFRRLARDYERLPETLAGLHFLAFVALLLRQLANQCVLGP
jgi:transposase